MLNHYVVIASTLENPDGITINVVAGNEAEARIRVSDAHPGCEISSCELATTGIESPGSETVLYPQYDYHARILAQSIKTWWQDEGYRLGNKPRFVTKAEDIFGEEF